VNGKWPDEVEDKQFPGFRPGPLFRDEESVDVEPFSTGVPEPLPQNGALDASDPSSVSNAMRADPVRPLLVDLTRELNREAAYSDIPLRQLLVIAAQAIVRPDRILPVGALPGLSEDDAEVLDLFQAFCLELGGSLDGSAGSREIMMGSVRDLLDHLDDTPPLTLATMALCYSVDGFGMFEAFPDLVFLAQEGQQVLVYLEVENFTSEMNESGEWLTKLSQRLEIYDDASGVRAWVVDWQPAVDRTTTKRNDFFTTQQITLPERLSIGRYHLKVTMRDELNDAEAEASVEFEITADTTSAARIP